MDGRHAGSGDKRSSFQVAAGSVTGAVHGHGRSTYGFAQQHVDLEKYTRGEVKFGTRCVFISHGVL